MHLDRPNARTNYGVTPSNERSVRTVAAARGTTVDAARPTSAWRMNRERSDARRVECSQIYVTRPAAIPALPVLHHPGPQGSRRAINRRDLPWTWKAAEQRYIALKRAKENDVRVSSRRPAVVGVLPRH
mmetsp:Transcript_29672/g.47386  ORF Transcript_29672/g.47386 Transcript_29672/m.47386 type:complete len:129 (-) Transcript_29672:477-863(-)